MKCNRLVDVGRRQFLRGGVLGVAGAAAATVMPAGQAQAQTARAMLDYPSTKLANLADLKVKGEWARVNVPFQAKARERGSLLRAVTEAHRRIVKE